MICKNKFLFLFLLVFTLSFSLVSSISITQIDSEPLSSTRGTAFIGFDNTGTKMYTIGNWHDSKPNYASYYNIFPAYNISNLALITDYNLTSIFPVLYENWSISTAYMTLGGSHLYIVISNKSGDNNDFNPHSINYTFLHYNITNFDLSTTSYHSKLEIVLSGNTYVSPSIYGVFVSEDGNYIITSGNVYSGSLHPNFQAYVMSSHFDLSTASPTASTPYDFSSSISYHSWASYANFIATSDINTIGFIERDIKQGFYALYLANRNNTGYAPLTVLTANREGLQIVQTGLESYLFAQGGGIIYKYRINDLFANSTGAINEGAFNGILATTVNSILSVFPNSSDLTFSQKLGYILITMIMTTVIILFASSRIGDGLAVFAMWIILCLLFAEFLYFVGIGYIPISIFILLVLIAIAFSYLKLKNSTSGGN